MLAVPTTTFADSSSGLGALGVDWKSLVIQLVTFLLAFLILQKYAFKPIAKILHERRELIESGVKLGEEMRQEKAVLDAKVTDALRKARKEADGIVAAAQDTARETIRDAETKAQTKAEGIIADAKARTEQDVVRARKALENEIIDLIADATEAIIEEKVDTKKDAALIDRALKEHAQA